MGLVTADDATRVRRLSRSEYDTLLNYLESLPAAGWTEQSACTDWKVYQVVSHLGSQARIQAARLEAGLRAAEPMTDEQRKALWAHFDSLNPTELLPAFREANGQLFALLESLTDEELDRSIPWIAGAVPVAVGLAQRLNEQVLHAWDIKWARDKHARLSPEAIPDLIELSLNPERLSGLARPERADELVGSTIQFVLTEPDGAAVVRLQQDGSDGYTGRAQSPDLLVELPSETFVRLLWGRCDVPAALKSGQLQLSRPDLAESLQALFPGR